MRVSLGGVIAGVLVLIVATICIRLGFWQLDRLEQRRDRNSLIAASLSEPPLKFDRASVETVASEPHSVVYRRARIHGNYLPQAALLLRGRAHDGRPGVHLIVPLRLAGADAIVLVNRGWLPSPDAATADPRPYLQGGTDVVEGLLHLVPHAGEESLPVEVELGDTTVSTFRRLDINVLSTRFRLPVLPVYLERTGTEDGLPAPISPPVLDEGPHLGYAVQWFGFAAVAIIGFLIVISRRDTGPRPEARPSRRGRDL